MNAASAAGSVDGGSPRSGRPMKRAASVKFDTRATASTPSFQLAHGPRRRERQRPGMLVLTARGHQVRHPLAEDVFRVLGPAAARGAVERVDRLAVVGRDDAARFDDGLGGQRIFRQRAEVHLARVGGADVVALVPVLPQVSLDVGAGGDGLRLERFDLSERGRTELVRHDAAQILLERKLVDDRQRVPGVAEHFERASIGASLDLERRAGRLDAQAGARAAPRARTSPSSSTVIRY